MTRFLSILLSIFTFFFSWLIPSEQPTEKPFEPYTIEINGVTYQNGFVPQDMHFKKEYDVDKEKPLYSQFALPEFINYYRFENNWIIRHESTTWATNVQDVLYCPIDEWENLRDYYADDINYNYQYHIRINGQITKYEIPNADTEMFNKILQFSDDNRYTSNSQNKAETITIPNALTPAIFFYKDSKDGIFTTHTTEFFIYEGHIYFYRYSNVAAGINEVAILPKEIEDYIISLLKTTELNEYFK